MKVSSFIRDDGACSYYRIKLPLSVCEKNNNIKAMYIEKGDNSDFIETKLAGADIVIVPRPSDIHMLKVINVLKEMGKKIIVDHDDNIFRISPLSPHYEDYGIENVEMKMSDGSVLKVWENGRNINLSKNKRKMGYSEEIMKIADMITVTTSILAETYKIYNKNIKALPNCIDTNIWQKLPLEKHEEIRLFWAGGASHYQDWCLLSDVLPEIMNKYSNVKLIILGSKFDGTLKMCPKNRVEHYPWVNTMVYPYKIAILDPDIAIIPLEDNEFNRCKSAIKWVEMGSIGVPSVTSYVSPYKEINENNNGIFIENNDKDAWIEGISYLIENREKRIEIGNNAKEYVYQNFDIHKKYIEWVKVYKDLTGGKDGNSNCTNIN